VSNSNILSYLLRHKKARAGQCHSGLSSVLRLGTIRVRALKRCRRLVGLMRRRYQGPLRSKSPVGVGIGYSSRKSDTKNQSPVPFRPRSLIANELQEEG